MAFEQRGCRRLGGIGGRSRKCRRRRGGLFGSLWDRLRLKVLARFGFKREEVVGVGWAGIGWE